MRALDEYMLTYGAFLENALANETFEEYVQRIKWEREIEEEKQSEKEYYEKEN